MRPRPSPARAVKLDQTYVTPSETHVPIELQGTTAMWEGDHLTVYEESQAIFNLRSVLAQMFGLPHENVRVITKFVGSGFGSKLWPWTHCPLAVAAARQLGKPVKLVLSRKMTFQAAGHRAHTQQRMRLGATPEGKLVSLQQDYVYERSMLEQYHENCGEATSFHYSVPNLRVHFGRARRNIGTPSDMRGPGAVPGLYATESAMNELADQLKIDPVQLRILNEPKIDEGEGIPFSSRHYVESLQLGSEKFGWSKRNAEVGSMKRDGLTLGWGVAGAAWIATRDDAAANVELRDDGSCSCSLWRTGYRHWHLYSSRPADRGQDRCASRESGSGARRYNASARPGFRWFLGDCFCGSCRFRRGGQCHHSTVERREQIRRDRPSKIASRTI